MSLKNLDKIAREAFFTAARYVAGTDRLISEAEKQWLREKAEELELEDSAGDGGDIDGAVSVLRRLSGEERAAVFEELQALAKCDNEYNSSEQIVINAFRDMLHVD